MALTDLAIRNLQAAEKPFKASDSGELHLLVSPNGSRMWRLKDRFEGKEKLLALGAYPIVTLAKAREKRDEAKAQLADGIDPAKSRRESRIAAVAISGNTFRLVAEDYLDKLWREGGRLPLWPRSNGCCPSPTAISASANFGDCRGRGACRPSQGEAARQVGERPAAPIDGGPVFRSAIATARAANDPTFALRGALVAPKVKHRAGGSCFPRCCPPHDRSRK